MLSENEAKRNKLGVRDIRSFMGVGKRKAVDGLDNVEKKIKAKAKVPGAENKIEAQLQNQAPIAPKTEQIEESQTLIQIQSGTETESESLQDKSHSDSHTPLDLNSTSNIFAGITVFINGSTLPQISEYKLKLLLAANGAKVSIYMARKTVTHVLIGQPNNGSSGAGGGLSASKIQQEIARGGWKGVKVVSVDWYVLFPHSRLRLEGMLNL
jgi:hypothetical protein